MTTPHLHLDHLGHPARRYAAASKKTRLAVTATLAALEVAALFLTHEAIIHLTLTGGITVWEALVIAAE